MLQVIVEALVGYEVVGAAVVGPAVGANVSPGRVGARVGAIVGVVGLALGAAVGGSHLCSSSAHWDSVSMLWAAFRQPPARLSSYGAKRDRRLSVNNFFHIGAPNATTCRLMPCI